MLDAGPWSLFGVRREGFSVDPPPGFSVPPRIAAK